MTTQAAERPATKQRPVVDDERWARVVARDKSADGTFWYSVATTGVYCRPSCPSHRANPGNVRLHATPAEARTTFATVRAVAQSVIACVLMDALFIIIYLVA